MARAPPAHPRDTSRSSSNRDDSESSHSRTKRSPKPLDSSHKPHKRTRLSVGAPEPGGGYRWASSSARPMTPLTPHGHSQSPGYQPRVFPEEYMPYPQDIGESERQVYVQPFSQGMEADGIATRRDPTKAGFTSIGSWCEPDSSDRHRRERRPILPAQTPSVSSRREGLLSPSPEPPSPRPGLLSHRYHFHHEGQSEQDRINNTWYLEGRAKMDSQRMLIVTTAAQTAC